MHSVLVVVATKNEIVPFLEAFPFKQIEEDVVETTISQKNVSILTNRTYELVINVGVCGAFNRSLKIGEVVEIISEQLTDLGAENGNSFISLFDMGLLNEDDTPFKNKKLNQSNNYLFDCKKVNGITVNTCHGNNATIEQIMCQYSGVDVESMEGGAIFFVCLLERVKFIQLRAVSNYVEKRNVEAWNLPLAIKNVNSKLETIIKNIV